MTKCNRHGVNNWLLNCEPIWFGIFMKTFRHTSKTTTNFQHFLWKHVFLTINLSGASQFLHNDRVDPKLLNWERFEKKSQKCQNRVIILQNLFPSQNTFWALDKIVQPKKLIIHRNKSTWTQIFDPKVPI